MLTEEAIEVVKHFDLLVDYEDAIRFIMNYVEQNDYIISCAYNSIGREKMKRFFYSDFIAIMSTIINKADEKSFNSLDPGFKQFLAEFYTEALAGVLVNWVKDRNIKDKEKIIEYLTTIMQTCLKYF